jgi:hypothetical protein
MGFFNKLFKRNIEGIVAPNQYYNPTTDDYEVIQGSNGAAQVSLAGSNVPDSQAIPVKISGADANGGAINTNTKSSEIIQPVDIQARYATTIQTQAGVMVAPSAWAVGSWIDTNGFDKVSGTMKNDASVASAGNIEWSNDGITIHGIELFFPNNTNSTKQGIVDTKARYFRFAINNLDAAPHTLSAWTYLKA